MHKLDKQILSVSKLLAESALAIPSYQRPYKWTEKNLNALLRDLQQYRKKSAYRLGAVVFHSHLEGGQECLDIVDGQQRTLTLFLLVKAILEERLAGLLREDIKTQLQGLIKPINDFLQKQHFSSDISHLNLHHNYLAARRAVSRQDFSEFDVDFLLNKCELVSFVLHDVSEAFQFFDSQNARGRDLEPHDLLKAFHLREFSHTEVSLKAQTVAHWESLDSDTLANTFANYLYRIRNWSRGKSAQHFGKDKTNVFKGINLEQVGVYPYVESLRIAHHFVDDYNAQYQRKIDHQKMSFPFHLDQMIINGRRFFEMIGHYQQTIANIINDECHSDNGKHIRLMGQDLSNMASKILRTINSYKARTRTGDVYIRNLFDCALIYYIDKFGTEDLSVAVEKLFVWAYSCRLRMQVVQLATMDNYALENNVFEHIKQSIQPSDLSHVSPKPLTKAEVRGTKVEKLVGLFTELKYYAE